MSAPVRGGLLDLLVPAELDRRAIEETLADWRDERRQAAGLARLIIDVRSLTALGRVATGIVVAPYTRIAIWRYLFFSLVTAIAIGMLVNIDMLVRSLTIAGSPQLWLSIVPASAALGLALTASAGLGLRKGHDVPLLSVAIGMFAMLVLLHGWVVPESNQRFREVVFSELSPGVALPTRGTAELTMPMLLESLSSDDHEERNRAKRALAMKASLLSLCMAVIALGESIRRRLPSHWQWSLLQAASGACAVGLAVGVLASLTPVLSVIPGPVALSAPPFYVRWFIAAGILLSLTCWLARRTPEPEPAPRT